MGIYNGDSGYDNAGIGVKLIKILFLGIVSIFTFGLPIIIAILKKRKS